MARFHEVGQFAANGRGIEIRMSLLFLGRMDKYQASVFAQAKGSRRQSGRMGALICNLFHSYLPFICIFCEIACRFNEKKQTCQAAQGGNFRDTTYSPPGVDLTREENKCEISVK